MDETNKSKFSKTAIVDVKPPDKNAPHPTSRPVVIPKAFVKDPMVNKKRNKNLIIKAPYYAQKEIVAAKPKSIPETEVISEKIADKSISVLLIVIIFILLFILGMVLAYIFMAQGQIG